jgi:hypothetical protein
MDIIEVHPLLDADVRDRLKCHERLSLFILEALAPYTKFLRCQRRIVPLIEMRIYSLTPHVFADPHFIRYFL